MYLLFLHDNICSLQTIINTFTKNHNKRLCNLLRIKKIKIVNIINLQNAVMGLGVKKGDEVTVSADDENVLAEMKKFFEENL